MAKSYTGYTVPLYLLTVMHGLYSRLNHVESPPPPALPWAWVQTEVHPLSLCPASSITPPLRKAK